MRVRLKNGSYEFVDSNEQFSRLVEQNMGEDAKSYVNNLIEEANYTTRKIDTDLDCYEEDLYSQRSAAQEMNDSIIKAINYIKSSKRLDKSELVGILLGAHQVYHMNF